MILYNYFLFYIEEPYEGTARSVVSSLLEGGFNGTVGSNR